MKKPKIITKMKFSVLLTIFFVFSLAPFLQAQDSLTGHFSILWGDSNIDSNNHATYYTLTDSSGKTSILNIDEKLKKIQGGMLKFNNKNVEVKGDFGTTSRKQNNATIIDVTSIQLISSKLSKDLVDANVVSGSKPWVSIMCKFSDYSDEPKDLSYFQNMYASTYPGFDHYWRELSYDTVNVQGSAAYGWFTLPHSESYYNPSDSLGGTNLSDLANDCIDSADSSVNFSLYSGINMMFNTNFDNGYAWGGSRYMTLDGVSKLWSVTWEPPWGYSSIGVIAHEMGHGFGLPHSSGDYGQTYDNAWDVMSDSWYNCHDSTDATYGCLGQHTISYHKDMLGWIQPSQKFIDDGNGALLTIDHLALNSTINYKMAQIPIQGSSTHFYTVEVRDKTNYDVKLPGKAVIIHEVDTSRSSHAHIVDVDGNGDTSDAGAMWIEGESFVDSTNGITVKVHSTTSEGFLVSINASAPTDINITNSSITENNKIGAIIGKLNATDPNIGDTKNFTLTCNSTNFSIDNNNNLIANISFKHEATPTQNVCVRVIDSQDNTYDKTLTITIEKDNRLNPSTIMYLLN